MSEFTPPPPELKITSDESPMYFVGIGASAGGLEALQLFLRNLTPDLNCSYIIAQHLSPTHKSMMVPLLARDTMLTVMDAENGAEIKKGIVYVTPPDKDVFISEDLRIILKVAQAGSTPKPSVDLFFESLAERKKEFAIGVILSGTGSDGSRGVRAIKAEGGLTISQDPSMAKYDGMPRSAINTGHIDIIIPPEDFAVEFEELIKRPRISGQDSDYRWEDSHKDKIFSLLLKRKKVDFSSYKQATVNRRIERRMSALKMTNIKEYVDRLESTPLEVDNLYKDMLIGVTSFFRDAKAFESLGTYLSANLESKHKGAHIRIWIAGCSTGEEAYSMAIALSEILGSSVSEYKIQIFATDLDEDAMTFARKGQYPESAVNTIKKSLLKKYFLKKGEMYEIIKPLRDMIIFSTHDLIKDPPFLKMDLVSCRNVMIYFNQNLQQKILASFHHALEVNGLLFLGKSESVSTNDDWFAVVDKNYKIFKSLYSAKSETLTYSVYTREASGVAKPKISTKKPKDIKEAAANAVMGSVFPYYVVLNEGFDILLFSGDENPYFTIGKTGDATLNVFKLISQDLALSARAVLHDVRKTNTKSFSKLTKITKGDTEVYVQLLAQNFGYENGERYYVLSFLEFPQEKLEIFKTTSSQDMSQKENQELEYELSAMREYLQTVIEELETSNEELQSVNEELQSGSEELQSSNEELQTTNEELQSTNEELQVAYAELKIILEERGQQKRLLDEQRAELEISNEKLERLNIELEDKVKAEVAARTDKELLASTIFRSANVGMCIFDRLGSIREPNDAFCRLSGYEKNELETKNFWSLIEFNTIGIAKKREIEDYLFGKSSMDKLETELQIISKSKSEHTASCVFSVLTMESIDYVVVSMIDRTKEKALENERQQQEAMLIEQSRSAQMGEMLSMIAHQWRQPLNAISLIAADMLVAYQDGELTSTEAEEQYHTLMSQLTYMSKTIDDFRNFFKKGEDTVFAAFHSVASAKAICEAQLKDKNIELILECDEKAKVYGNENRLTQVLLALISNSKDAILDRQETEKIDGVIRVALRKQDKQIVIDVADNGKGANETTLQKMFDAYYTTKHAGAGTGLGLHMAKAIIERNMHGQIRAKNVKGGGLCVSIILEGHNDG